MITKVKRSGILENLSSRYDDRELVVGENQQEKLDDLSQHLNEEIDACSNDPVKLDRLATRYESDAAAAKAENNMGYFMRYEAAMSRTVALEQHIYSMMYEVI